MCACCLNDSGKDRKAKRERAEIDEERKSVAWDYLVSRASSL